MSRTQSKSFDGPNLFQAIQQDRRAQEAADQATFDTEDIMLAMTLPPITEITNKDVEYGALMWLQTYSIVPYDRHAQRYQETFNATKAKLGFKGLSAASRRHVHEGMCRARQAINDAIRINTEQDELDTT